MLVINQCPKKGFATASTCSFVIGLPDAPTQAFSCRGCVAQRVRGDISGELGKLHGMAEGRFEGGKPIETKGSTFQAPRWEETPTALKCAN
ncbi:hypothetical protein IVB30_36875 [Bradyrhizobium sp. 200]|uniref:hypothetical protein n=1 Tax=Bradyrhizobium sp. 200 TaxID=2782665 RepID=UPI001FFE9EF3|nr:hypothetical protein [Bradyrhizobium sp. 200]UPJ48556.1 hypothetical protein IVB30_36875 [Bradyrhizobium sp. 200]